GLSCTLLPSFSRARETKLKEVPRGLCFFASRRRHTRFKCDRSSDVCSSDLPQGQSVEDFYRTGTQADMEEALAARRSEERREGKSVDLGGRRIITQNTE